MFEKILNNKPRRVVICKTHDKIFISLDKFIEHIENNHKNEFEFRIEGE